jgi:acid phosphatase (class A)
MTSTRLRFPRLILLGAALLVGPLEAADAPMLGAAKPAALYFLAPGAIDLAKILPPPPAPGSITAQADLETVLQVQATRTPEQAAWAKFIEADDLFENSRVLGDWFTAANLPITAEFFRQATSDSTMASNTIKALYSRPRPPKVDGRVQPCVNIPKTGSYPSGHAMRAALRAALLSEIFPERKAELDDFARKTAWGRIIGGVHFPTDIMAGKLLGDALAAELLKNPAVRAAIERCRAEAQPYLLKKAA